MAPSVAAAATPLWHRVLVAFLVTVSPSTVFAVGGEDLIVLEDFSDPLRVWRTFGDPHMGGTSDGAFTVDQYEGVGRFFGAITQLPPRKDGKGSNS